MDTRDTLDTLSAARSYEVLRVVLDGEMAAERIDGRSLTVAPGPRVARFHRTGRLPLEVTFVARPGEKNRAVHAAFEPSDRIVASNVSLSIGAVALATAAVIWLVEPKH